MSEYVCFLITVLMESDSLVTCALKVKSDDLSEDCIGYPMEEENKATLWDLLPPHVQSIGKIVEVKEIFEVHVV
ncbi:hypothetical protein LCGC14_1790470 [marine sediment metagenome]|uniref:Uncharacterized protein n=1 Tax=marine sediment metagenome TaxID=412755 RepID=A0A0F9J7L2_9ZZZZ